jgi:hypothetical protein
MRALIAVLLGTVCLSGSPKPGPGRWAPIGSPGGCDITASIEVGSNVFVSTFSYRSDHRVFVSADRGISWKPADSGFSEGAWVGCFALRGTSLFAGTYGDGVFVSDDSGTHWRETGAGLPRLAWIYGLATLGADLYAGTAHHGVFVLKSGSDRWLTAGSGIPAGAQITTFASNGTCVFAGTAGAGVFALKPGDMTWVAVSSGLPDKTRIECLTVRGQILLASARGRLFRSADGGARWTPAGEDLPGAAGVTCFAFGSSAIYAGTAHGGILTSRDEGLTWSVTGGALEPWEVAALAVADGILFAGTESGGAFISIDEGATWTTANAGLPQEGGIGGVEVIGKRVFVATSSGTTRFMPDGREFEGGIFVTADSGASWVPSNRGLTSTILFGLKVIGPDLFAATGNGIFTSPDIGRTWRPTNSGLPERIWIDHFAASPPYLYVSAAEGIFRSADSGGSWNLVPGDRPAEAVLECFAADGPAFYAAFSRSDLDPAVAGDYERYSVTRHRSVGLGVMRSTDRGWQSINAGLPDEPYVNCLKADGPDLYAGLMRPTEMEGKAITRWPSGLGFFYSHDGGASWHPAERGFPADEMVLALALRGETIFAATSGKGILVSRDKGRSWKSLDPKLPASGGVQDLIIRGSSLYAVGDGGVWRLPLDRVNEGERR